MAAVHFKKMLICILRVVENPHFESNLLGGRGQSQKRTLCMILIMLTILDDDGPL